MLIKSCSLVGLKRTAEANGYRLVATPQRGHIKEYTPLTLADVANVINATNEGLLWKDEMNAIVSRFNRQDGPIAVVYINEQGLLDYMVSL